MNRPIELETALAELLQVVKDFADGKYEYTSARTIVKEALERYEKEVIVYSLQLEQHNG